MSPERGRPGEIYFVTDGDPIAFRTFITALLETQGMKLSEASIPRWIADAAASVSEVLWRIFPLSGEPPLTRTALTLIGEEVTVNDQKARRELGYQGAVTREQGLAEMREHPEPA